MIEQEKKTKLLSDLDGALNKLYSQAGGYDPAVEQAMLDSVEVIKNLPTWDDFKAASYSAEIREKADAIYRDAEATTKISSEDLAFRINCTGREMPVSPWPINEPNTKIVQIAIFDNAEHGCNLIALRGDGTVWGRTLFVQDKWVQIDTSTLPGYTA